MKINKFLGELTDISAKKEPLVVHVHCKDAINAAGKYERYD